MLSQPPRRNIDKARWPRLSPLLDELLDLSADQRPARLGVLEAEDPELAADLRELLWRQDAMDAANYLATPALQAMEAQQVKPSNRAGQQIGAYSLEREIGRGGMGTVWLARRTDGRFEGLVAIKFLNAGLLGRGDAGRFAREGQILARLAHPHIARLLDAGITANDSGEQPYLVLEYVDGLPLDRYCETQALKARARVALFQDVLAAVAHAHTRLILHRDLKPSNILVTSAGEVKLLDFGIAKLLHEEGTDREASAATELSALAGRAFTPRYAAPEQVQGGEVSTATDVYALGVLLYLLLSGQHPTTPGDEEQTTPLERMRTLVEVAPKKLSDQVTDNKPLARELRGDLDTIVAKALKKLPAERYTNAAELAEDLRRWFNHEPITARPDSKAYIFAKFVRRHRVAVAAGSLGLLTLSASVGVALLKGQEAQEQRVQAEGLIEFMLGDLRKKLEPVGRLDVLDAVGEKALGYYAQQQLGSTDADSLGRRARALHLMGEIAEKRGKLDEADQFFKQAAISTSELLSRSPRDTRHIFEHAQSEYWVGYIARRRGEAGEAHQKFESYLALATQLTQIEPGHPRWEVEQASAQMNLGVLLLDSGQTHGALAAFTASVGSWNEIATKNPESNFELANAHGWVARTHERVGNFQSALKSLDAKVAAIQARPSTSANSKLESLLAGSYYDAARMHLALGQADSARQAASASIQRFTRLVASDPENLDWLLQLCQAKLELADALDTASLTQAIAPFERLNRDVERLLLQGGGNKLLPKNVALKARWLLLDARKNPSNYTQSRGEPLRAFIQEVGVLAQAGKTLSPSQQGAVARVELLLGDLLSRTSPPQALALWERVSATLLPASEKGDIPLTVIRAHALARLGKTQEAQSLVERLKASDYKHPLYAELLTFIANTSSQGNAT